MFETFCSNKEIFLKFFQNQLMLKLLFCPYHIGFIIIRVLILEEKVLFILTRGETGFKANPWVRKCYSLFWNFGALCCLCHFGFPFINLHNLTRNKIEFLICEMLNSYYAFILIIYLHRTSCNKNYIPWH